MGGRGRSRVDTKLLTAKGGGGTPYIGGNEGGGTGGGRGGFIYVLHRLLGQGFSPLSPWIFKIVFLRNKQKIKNSMSEC